MSEEITTKKGHVDLQPRRSPLQSRAKQTVERILEATADVLDEEGSENLTTERVAERSGVNIATLYHYFPNKLALLYALGDRLARQQEEWLNAIWDRYGELGWREVVDAVSDAVLKFHRTVKGATAVSRAMKGHSTLREIDREQDLRQSEAAASLLAQLGIKGSRSQLQKMSLIMLQTATAVLDNALAWDPENADAAMAELKLMHKKYIEHYLSLSAEDPDD